MNLEKEGMIEGVVSISKDGSACPVTILSDAAVDSKGFYPVNLDKSFHKDGLEIKFNYTLSRAPLPTLCEEYTAIVIDAITNK